MRRWGRKGEGPRWAGLRDWWRARDRPFRHLFPYGAHRVAIRVVAGFCSKTTPSATRVGLERPPWRHTQCMCDGRVKLIPGHTFAPGVQGCGPLAGLGRESNSQSLNENTPGSLSQVGQVLRFPVCVSGSISRNPERRRAAINWLNRCGIPPLTIPQERKSLVQPWHRSLILPARSGRIPRQGPSVARVKSGQSCANTGQSTSSGTGCAGTLLCFQNFRDSRTRDHRYC